MPCTHRAHRYACVAVLVVGLPSTAFSQLIGVYSDSLASSCNLTIPFPGPPVDVYVVFTPGPMADSMAGGSFYIQGLPEGWSAQAFANPNGDCLPWCEPFEAQQITFSTCQTGSVGLFRLRLTPSSAVTNHELQVVAGHTPPELSCPYAFGCAGQPGTTLSHAIALINSPSTCIPSLSGPCPTVDTEDYLPAATTVSIAPNPATAEVAIRYSLAPADDFARLTVCDVAGRVVARLREGPAMARAGSIGWDWRDGRRAQVGAGVYFVRLETDKKSVARRVVLIR